MYFATSKILPIIANGPEPDRPWLAVLDWDITQMDGSLLETWLPTVFENLEFFAKQYKARFGNLGVWIEDRVSGSVLIQQALNSGLNVHAIDSKLTQMGKAERAINVSGYVHRGEVKITQHAFDKTVTYKAVTKNHFLAQFLGFRAGIKDQVQDDLLDCASYGIAISLGSGEGF
jgi:hypothetical protein